MKLDTLPSPGFIPSGISLRSELTRAISYVEVMADLKGGTTEQATTLTAFLNAAVASIAALKDVTLPTLVSGLLARSVNDKALVLTFSEALDPAVVPALTSFAVALDTVPNAVTAITVQGTLVTLTLTTSVVAGALTVAYTQPAVNRLRDLSGNQLASFAATAVTNQA